MHPEKAGSGFVSEPLEPRKARSKAKRAGCEDEGQGHLTDSRHRNRKRRPKSAKAQQPGPAETPHTDENHDTHPAYLEEGLASPLETPNRQLLKEAGQRKEVEDLCNPILTPLLDTPTAGIRTPADRRVEELEKANESLAHRMKALKKEKDDLEKRVDELEGQCVALKEHAERCVTKDMLRHMLENKP